MGALSGLAAAQPLKITVATTVLGEVKLDRDAEFAKTFNYVMIERANPLDVGLEVVKGEYPNNKQLASFCKKSVLGRLKAPATARFAKVNTPRYNVPGGVYYVSGAVDAENSYGALIRNSFYCVMAYSGNEKAGLLYVLSDVYSR